MSRVQQVSVNVYRNEFIANLNGKKVSLTIAEAIELRRTIDRYLPYWDDAYNTDAHKQIKTH